MRLKQLAAALLLPLCLAGCGKPQSSQRALDLRSALMQSRECSFTAEITSESDDRVYGFTVQCHCTPEQTRVQVLAPDAIAGITAVISKNGAQVEYEDSILELGNIGSVSPMAAAELLYRCWVGEYIVSAGKDGETERVSYLPANEEAVTVDTWLDQADVPIYAEISEDGVRRLRMTVTDFQK